MLWLEWCVKIEMNDMISSPQLEEHFQVLSDTTRIIWIYKKGDSYDNVTVS